MSFAIRNLSVLAYANGFTLWHYKADADALPTVSGAGYFDDAVDMLAGGDMMLVSASDGGQVLCIGANETGLSVSALT
jgi:hypothetical protein